MTLGRNDRQPGTQPSSRPPRDSGHMPWHLGMLILFSREGSVGAEGVESSDFSGHKNSCSPPQSDPRSARLGHGNAHAQGSGGKGRRDGFAGLLGRAPGA